jgi:hypothetical protein
MARMLDFGKFGLERRLEHRGWVVGAQLKPGAQARLLVIGCFVGELDAEMSPAGKADNEHRLIDAGKLNGPYGAAKDGLKALSQFPAPVRPHEDMHIAAKSDHDVAGLSCRSRSHPQSTTPQPLHPPTRPGHDVLSCRAGEVWAARHQPLGLTGGDSPVTAAVQSIC